MRQKISVIVPCYNEGANVDASYEAIVQVFKRPDMADYDLELIYSDNHSTDDSFQRVKRLAAADPRVRGVRYSRNVGFQRSILTGYRMATGEAAIQFDCDLQDPADLMPVFIEHWKQGYKVVYGVRKKRQEGWLNQLQRRIFYRVLARVSEDDLPIDAGDFRLVDRRVLDVLRDLRDLHPYLRGVITAIGFDQLGVEYERNARTQGYSKFNLSRNIALATDALVNHSMAPLRLATWIASMLIVGLVLAGVWLAVSRLWASDEWPRGIALLAGLQLIGLTFQAIFFGIMGEYIGRLYRQSKDQWPVVIEEQV